MLMALCEMCGKEADIVEADIEGVELNVCPGCVKFGVQKSVFFGPKKAGELHSNEFSRRKTARSEPELKIAANYSQLIRLARDKRNLNQEDFAKLINERESLVAKWESGLMKPNIDAARRLEKLLRIQLVEEEDSISFAAEKRKADELTLGDFVKIRTRK